ncbi:AsnC family protein [Sinosporangium album]|uniref:AsnC family protein n=1 Tax=Sinosporangium album TaxID=504805 RepID=A0A1G7XLZ1_9ACTN|nr:Lrp/AsnC ligand binding domain-containing protein [Sinosporangium album]SDG85215.1 AsnC family protein [Sinosporangium album]
MVTAIVHINAEVDRIPEVAQAIAALDEVSEVYSITGEYDLLAMVRVASYEQVAEVIPGRLNKIPGVLDTVTQLAFRTYSRHDLDAAFSLGLSESD